MPRLTDLEMMKRPAQWPRWPLLPLKRPRPEGGFPDTGFLAAYSTQPSTATRIVPDAVVMLGSIYQIKESGSLRALVEGWERKEKFDSLEALVAAGWRVD